MITAHPFGSLSDGTPVTRYRLSDGSGAHTDILDYGATVQSLVVPDRSGTPTDVVLGYPTPQTMKPALFTLAASWAVTPIASAAQPLR